VTDRPEPGLAARLRERQQTHRGHGRFYRAAFVAALRRDIPLLPV
jgi:hypothetical protein